MIVILEVWPMYEGHESLGTLFYPGWEFIEKNELIKAVRKLEREHGVKYITMKNNPVVKNRNKKYYAIWHDGREKIRLRLVNKKDWPDPETWFPTLNKR